MQRQVRPQPLRPELPAGAAADRGRRALRDRQHVRDGVQRDHLGHPRLGAVQPDRVRTATWSARCSTTPTRRCSRISRAAGCSTTRWSSRWASSAARRRSTRPAAATTGRSAGRSRWPAAAIKGGQVVGASDEIGALPEGSPDARRRRRRDDLHGARHRPRRRNCRARRAGRSAGRSRRRADPGAVLKACRLLTLLGIAGARDRPATVELTIRPNAHQCGGRSATRRLTRARAGRRPMPQSRGSVAGMQPSRCAGHASPSPATTPRRARRSRHRAGLVPQSRHPGADEDGLQLGRVPRRGGRQERLRADAARLRSRRRLRHASRGRPAAAASTSSSPPRA